MARRVIEDFEEELEMSFADEEAQDQIELDLENDEISPEEEGFMRGAMEASEY